MKTIKRWIFCGAAAGAFLLLAPSTGAQEQHNREQQNPEARSQENTRSPEPARTQQGQRGRRAKGNENTPIPPERSSVTHHELTLGGKTLKYTATAGTLLIRDEDDKPYGSIFYVAYTLDGAEAQVTPGRVPLQRRPGLVHAVAAHGLVLARAHSNRQPQADRGTAVRACCPTRIRCWTRPTLSSSTRR